MDSTVAVQIKGFGFLFQAARNSVIAFSRSSTLRKEPRRMRLLVNSPNQRSTRFSQLELVGTKCETKRGWRFSQAWTLGFGRWWPARLPRRSPLRVNMIAKKNPNGPPNKAGGAHPAFFVGFVFAPRQ